MKPNELLNEFDFEGIYPVPVIDVANAMGVEVFLDSKYLRHKDGHLEISENDRMSIIVNKYQCPERKRFTIAHEIGHIQHDLEYLKKHGSIDRDGCPKDESYRAREIRANRFAADLLMPSDYFIEMWLENRRNIHFLADHFFVSKEAIHFRAINLGLEGV